MARYCTNCGHELPEGKGFCPECGVPITEETPLPQGPEEGLPPLPAAPQPPRLEEQGPKQERPEQSAPPTAAPAPVYVAAAQPESPPVSTAGFFGLEFLYKIPIVSFICSIVLSIAPKNKNVRHHAQAKLIWKILGTVLLVAFFLLLGAGVRKFANAFRDALTQITGNEYSFSSIQDLEKMEEDLQGLMQQYGIEDLEDLDELQELLRENGIESFGDLQGILEENGAP
jgi:hypothetical protein